MGAGTEKVLNDFNIPPLESTDLPEWSRHFPLVLGLASADKIAAVSPTYMQELKQEEFGNGLKDFFIQEEEKTVGILNGIDYGIWDPQADPVLNSHFSVDDLQNKKSNKEEVLRLAGLSGDASTPLLVAVTRLGIQKGTDLIISALPQLMGLDWRLVILGSGDKGYEERLLELQSQYPDRIRIFLEFNAPLSHQLYAGGDIFLMPSRYEPCGLSQMIAMRYGCIPVARAVGGLKDTINADADQSRTGYLFREADASSFSSALRRALHDYQDKDIWSQLQRRAMRVNFSWERSARQYLQLYRDLIEK
jgi:starch synthase